jgi:hypothetical protein
MWIRDAVYDFDFYATAMEAMIGGYPRDGMITER